MKSILVPGAGGQLGSELEQIQAEFPDFQFTFIPEEGLDISDEPSVMTFFESTSFDFCINCAAYTAVDNAEEEKEKANQVNASGTGILARACLQFGTTFIIFSTDYVFDGQGNDQYKEDDKTNPINAYGHSKLKGEHIALNVLEKVICIRTSWLYSSYGKNFVKTMLKLASKKDEIGVVNDQIGSPTYARDLALAIMHLITRLKDEEEKNGFVVSGKYGIYHYANTGEITWADFAREIMEYKRLDTVIKSIKTADYETKAKRPKYSVLDQAKIMRTFDLEIPDWKKSLHHCLDKL